MKVFMIAGEFILAAMEFLLKFIGSGCLLFLLLIIFVILFIFLIRMCSIIDVVLFEVLKEKYTSLIKENLNDERNNNDSSDRADKNLKK